MSFTITPPNPNSAISIIERLARRLQGRNSVKVGLPRNSNDYPDGTSVIMVGTVHEFGSPLRGIPQRSFLRTTLVENRNDYKMLFKQLSKQIIDGNIDKEQALSTIGLQVQSDVVGKITDIRSPSLKHRDGNPLIDTGHLRQSITFEVVE